jgi:hypothetical protein
LRNAFLKQQELVKQLHDVAVEVKQCKDSVRSAVLSNRLIQVGSKAGGSGVDVINANDYFVCITIYILL